MINLASARLGAKTLRCSDDSFADMSRLIQDHDPVWVEDKYDDFGKWMDGWESKRRRSGGYDWCLLELAVPGKVSHFEVDTRYFTGNFPPGAQIFGASGDTLPDEDSVDWVPLTDLLELQGNHQHPVPALDAPAVRFIKFCIYPDGGVARLRVYGEAQVAVSSSERAELSSLLLGGRIVGYSDAHYGNVEAVLTPGRGVDMGDGWETARRRVPGHEWIIIQLGLPGVIDAIEIDTAHFKGNFPGAVSVQAASMPALGDKAIITQAMFWPEVMAQQPLTADSIHTFELATQSPVTHVKINNHPDGGMSRIRVFGQPV